LTDSQRVTWTAFAILAMFISQSYKSEIFGLQNISATVLKIFI